MPQLYKDPIDIVEDVGFVIGWANYRFRVFVEYH